MQRYFFLPKSAEMKFGILHALDRPIDDMSVGEICKNAGISRQTFYNHFESKYQIAYWFLDFAFTMYFERIGTDLKWDESVQATMEFIGSEREHLQHAFARNPEDNEVEPQLEKRKQKMLNLLSRNGVDIDEEMVFYVNFHISQGNQLIVDWCLGAYEISPTLMAKYFTGCTPMAILQALNVL